MIGLRAILGYIPKLLLLTNAHEVLTDAQIVTIKKVRKTSTDANESRGLTQNVECTKSTEMHSLYIYPYIYMVPPPPSYPRFWGGGGDK